MFLEAFAKENDSELASIKQWRNSIENHKHVSSGKYSADSLASPYYYYRDMMCRMWGIHDSAKFTIEMVPIMEVASNVYVMDWTNILSNKIATTILEYKTNSHQYQDHFPILLQCIHYGYYLFQF